MYKNEKTFENGLSIKCEERDMGWGIDFSMTAVFPHFLNLDFYKKHQNEIKSIAVYTANKLHYSLLTDGLSILKKIHELNFPMPEDYVHIAYSKDRVALVRPYFNRSNQKIDINPYVKFESVNEWGFTLTPGNFSDFIISTRFDDSLFAYTKDFLPRHFPIASIFLINFCENVENFLIKGVSMPADSVEWIDYSFMYMNPTMVEVKKEIETTIKEKTSENKGKRIDSLIVNKKNIFDLIREYNIHYSVCLQSTDIINIALQLKKPPLQVETFIRKYIDRKRVS